VDTLRDRETDAFRNGGDRLLSLAAEFVAIAAVYFVLAKGSLAFASINPSATPVWPPTGFALAVTLLGRPRVLLAIFLGALAANVTTAGTIATSAAIAFGNASEAFIGAAFMNRWANGRAAFQSPPDIAKFAVILAGASTPVSATIGITALSLAGFAAWGDFADIWVTWWLGDVAGGIMIAPAVLLWANTARVASAERVVTWESALLLLCTAVVGALALGPFLPPISGRNALAFLTIFPLLWAALRHGERDTATVALILSAFAVWGAAQGTGPFVQPTLNASLLLLVSFIAAITLPSLGLSAAVASHQRARLRSEEAYQRLVDSVRDYAIYMMDPEGHVTTWNGGAERIKGYSRDAILGRHFSCFYTEEDREKGLPALGLATAAETGRFESEGWRVRQDGSRFRASVVISSIRDDHGQLVGFAKVTRDVTEAREAQEALEKTREELHQAQKLEALGQLTGGVAHDFNNLLMAISGGVSMLAGGKGEQREKILKDMQQTVERGAGLTRQLLAFARRETLHPEIVDVGERITAMKEMLGRSLGPGIRLELLFPPGLWPIEVDRSHLELAILNLVINARDAMPDGGVLAIGAENVSPEASTDGEGSVSISVRDVGVGMAPEVRARAFEPFYSTKGPGRGTGLGLSQVHGFAEQSGGSARIESEVGRGTVVTLTLPRARKTAPSPGETAHPASAQQPVSGNILVVEDDDRVAVVVCAMIEDLGYRVTHVGDALQALEELGRSEERFDLVFSDIIMPGTLNGLQLAATIRERRPDLPIVLTSGYAGGTESQSELTYQVLEKPYGATELRAAFHTALASRPG
jgi:PAS domain S-box-containing protein